MLLRLIFFVLFFPVLANSSIPIGNLDAPKKGMFLNNLGQQPTTLNYLSSSDYYASVVQSYIVESLADKNIETDTWDPALASSWEINDDATLFTFTLREGITFHDGKPLTPEDVKFTFEAIMDKENRWKTAHQKPYFENIKEVKILGKNKVQFVAKRKYFKNFDVVAGMGVVPKHLYEDLSKKNLKKLNKTLVGTGPYILSKFRRGKSIVLKKNKDWWGNKVPIFRGVHNFEKLLLRFIKDDTIALTRFEKGDLDYLALNAEQYMKKAKGKRWDKGDIFKFKVENKAPKSYGFIGWNLRNPLFKSKKTRLALYHLLNRDLMIKKFDYDMNLPATGPLYQQSPYANPDVKVVEYDPKKALKILRGEGWKAGEDNVLYKEVNGQISRLSFTILEPNKEFVKYLTIFKEDASKAGVEVKIKYVEWTTFIKLLDERKFEAVRLGWSGGAIDWDPKQVWHSSSADGGGSNFIGYSNPEVDKLIDEARLTLDRAKRIEILQKVYKLIAEDYPYAFFFNAKYGFYAHSKRIQKEKETYTYGVGTSYWWVTK